MGETLWHWLLGTWPWDTVLTRDNNLDSTITGRTTTTGTLIPGEHGKTTKKKVGFETDDVEFE